MGTPFALDSGAVLMMGQALDADLELLAEVLPTVSTAIIAAMRTDDDAD